MSPIVRVGGLGLYKRTSEDEAYLEAVNELHDLAQIWIERGEKRRFMTAMRWTAT